MHSCSTPNVPPVITCRLPNCCTLLGKALDEVAPRWELALQTQGRDGKVVGDLIVAESPRFCMRHRRQAQLTRRTQSANPWGTRSGWSAVCSPLTNGSIRRQGLGDIYVRQRGWCANWRHLHACYTWFLLYFFNSDSGWMDGLVLR